MYNMNSNPLFSPQNMFYFTNPKKIKTLGL
jgi:hypothetical protein